MHFSLALLISLPIGTIAGPLSGNTFQIEERRDKRLPGWNGKCTSTRSATKTVTSTRKVTRYPSPTTTTIYFVKTSTETKTLPPQTSVFSTTSTFFATTTATESITQTDTVTESFTTDVAPPTSTVAAPAGMTPIRSVYPNSAKRAPEDNVLKVRQLENRGYVAYHPSDLKCTTTRYKTVTQKTKTHYKTTTSTAKRQTITKKRTSIITSTESVLPSPVSQTETFSTTSTITETSTSTALETTTTSTTTTQTVGPTPTFYAACGPDNILSQYNGNTVDTLLLADPLGSATLLPNTNSAYDCCVACLQTSGCAGSGYTPGICFGLTADVQCNGGLSSGTFVARGSSGGGFQVSNSGCGQWKVGSLG